MRSKEFLDLITKRRTVTKQKIAYIEKHIRLEKSVKELLEDSKLISLLEKEKELIFKRNQLFEQLCPRKTNE